MNKKQQAKADRESKYWEEMMSDGAIIFYSASMFFMGEVRSALVYVRIKEKKATLYWDFTPITSIEEGSVRGLAVVKKRLHNGWRAWAHDDKYEDLRKVYGSKNEHKGRVLCKSRYSAWVCAKMLSRNFQDIALDDISSVAWTYRMHKLRSPKPDGIGLVRYADPSTNFKGVQPVL